MPQQILRDLYGIDNYAVRTHERHTGVLAFQLRENSWALRTLECDIICSPISHRQMAPAK